MMSSLMKVPTPYRLADLRAMATECDRASLARVREVAIDLRPSSRRSALVARTNAASVRGPALAGTASASMATTSSNGMSRRRTNMGALLGKRAWDRTQEVVDRSEGCLEKVLLPGLALRFAFRPCLVRRQQLVADATDGGDHRLVLGAELGPEAADVDVHGAGAAEEVVAPDLLEELGPGRDPAGAGGQEPKQLELLVGQVERPAPEADLVGDGVDDQVADPDGGVRVGHHRALGEQPDPGLDLGRAGGGEHEVGGAPVALQPGQAGLGHDDQDGQVVAGAAQDAAERLGAGEVAGGVDHHRLLGRRHRQAGLVQGQGGHRVGEVLQGGKDLLRPPGPAGQAGELGHLVSSEAGSAAAAANSRAPYHSDMVRIRLFAALREAAGVAEVEAPPAPLQAILDELGDRFGERFVAVLGYSSVLVDGERWRDPAAVVPDGAELALLPP